MTMAHEDLFEEFNALAERLARIHDDVYDQVDANKADDPDYEVMNEALDALVSDLSKASLISLRAMDTWAEINENGAGIR